jgi:3'-phosphoadenosine 5'-phosphosulfate (PAPS) 3'-phosphatase
MIDIPTPEDHFAEDLFAEVRFAIETVRQAALLVRQVQAAMVTSSLTKEDRSPVTVADFASQALVGHRLSQAFPNDPLVGEEIQLLCATLSNALLWNRSPILCLLKPRHA